MVEGATDRQYEIGTGISTFGEPRGSKLKHSGIIEVAAYGIGAIHVRIVDDGSPATIIVAVGTLGTITVIDIDF